MAETQIGASVTSTEGALGAKTAGLGDRYTDQVGKEYVYVQATSAITGAGYVAIIDEAYAAVMVSTSVDKIGNLIGVAGVAFAAADYGWLQVKGPCLVRVAASCAANVTLNTTATAGQLDDDGTAGALAINGLVLTTARSASAGTAAGLLNYCSVASDVVLLATLNATRVNATLRPQGVPAAKTVTAAITAAELVAGLITTTGVTAPSIHQLPTGTLIDAELPGVATGDSFDFTVTNTGTGASDDATITVNTDVTIVGNPTIGALTDATIIAGSGRFRARRSAANTYVVYRLA